jgi:ribonuclease P protein component
MRSGRKIVGETMVIYLKTDSNSNAARFGFVVSKSVGSAVERNLTKRRLRAAVRNSLNNYQVGQTLVIRALPSINRRSWQDIEIELAHCTAQAFKQTNNPDLLIR